jgi:lysophospholipase L1-like esterase
MKKQSALSGTSLLFLRSFTLVFALVLMGQAPLLAARPEFADFDRRAKAGEHLNVVFFGASLTWGANATDPQQTSYRARIGQRLERKYPAAHFKFWDAAIGGTGSQLGVFRFNRDVLARKPDLVFLDFSANDDINSANPETLASYESLVRRTIVEAGAPVVPVILPFMWDVAKGRTDGMLRRDAHLKIAAAYHAPVGDAIQLAQQRVKAGEIKIEQLWPVDGVHPGDTGYELFADAAWDALMKGIDEKTVCAAPEKMLYAETYMKNARVRISSLTPLPEGWKAGAPHVVSAYFDMLMSRWLDDEVIASSKSPMKRLAVRFSGSMVMLFGESTTQSGKYRVYIDGQLVKHTAGKQSLEEFDAGDLAKRVGGNAHHAQVLAEALDASREHTLEIEPVIDAKVVQEWRFESICVAGGEAKVSR